MENRPKTIICDIDGTLIYYNGDICRQHLIKPSLLPGVAETLKNWDRKGYHIILITGRRESVRTETEKQLSDVGIFYDTLIMGVGGGTRILINDRKYGSDKNTAESVSLIRNAGLTSIRDM